MNIRSFLTGETNDNDSCFPSLTFNERLMGFAICVGVGKCAIIQGISSSFYPSDLS